MSTRNVDELLAAEAEDAEAGRELPYPQARRIRARSEDPGTVFSVRIPKSRLDELRTLASEQHTTPGALLRQWVLERLEGNTTGSIDLDAVRQVVREELAANQ